MPKKSTTKRRSPSKKSSNVGEDSYDVRTLALYVGIFFFGLVCIHLLGHPANAGIHGNAPLMDSFADNWRTGNFDASFAKTIFFAIVLLFTNAVFSFTLVNFNALVRFVLSVLISVAAVAYMTPDQVYVLLTTYNSFGSTIVLTVVSVVLFLSTIVILSPFERNKLTKKWQFVPGKLSKNPWRFVLTSIVWLWFTGFVVSNSIKGLRSGVPLDGGMTVVILITILVGLIMAFSPKTFLKPITRGILSFMKFENEVGQQIDDFNRASPVDLVRKRPGY